MPKRPWQPQSKEAREEWVAAAHERLRTRIDPFIDVTVLKADKWKQIASAHASTEAYPDITWAQLCREFMLAKWALTTRLASWAPLQHTMMIAGRPVEAHCSFTLHSPIFL